MSELDIILEQIKNLNKEIKELKNNVLPKVSKYKLFEWLDFWRTTYKTNIKSQYQVKNCIDKHIKQNIENKFMHEYNAFDFQGMFNNIKSSRMAEYTYDYLSESLNQAVSDNIIDKSPLTSIKRPKHKRLKGKALTKEEVNHFLNLVKMHTNKVEIFQFYLLTGCRPEEPYNIKFSDVDFVNKKLHIPGTKTESSDRYIPLFNDLEKLIKSIFISGKYLFNYTYNSVYCTMKRLKNNYNLWFTIRSFRHTFATRCLESGVKIKTISKWLGHTSTRMADIYYIDILPDFEKSEVELVNKNLLLKQ